MNLQMHLVDLCCQCAQASGKSIIASVQSLFNNKVFNFATIHVNPLVRYYQHLPAKLSYIISSLVSFGINIRP